VWWRKKSDPREYSAPDGIPTPDKLRTLQLYKFDRCPYCVRVFRVVERLNLSLTYRDTRNEISAHQSLIERTGRTQVPCLFIDDVPLFESNEICDWLEAYAIRGST